jgi:small-conductance mechanosensitive channel
MDIPSIETQKVTAKIETLKGQREQFVAQANQQIAFFNGQIAALEALLKPEEPAPSEAAQAKE